MVQNLFPGVRLFALKDNPGYGAAMNIAISKIDAPFVLMLNGDTCMRPGSLAAIEAYLDSHPRVGIAGPRLTHQNGTLQRSARCDPGTARWLIDNHLWGHCFRHIPGLRQCLLNAWPHDHPRRVPWILGAAMGGRTEALMEVGGFDRAFFMYFEDIDLCDRLWSAGWEVHFMPDAEVMHLGGASTRKWHSKMEEHYFSSALCYYRRRYSIARFMALKRVMQIELATRVARDVVRLRLSANAVDGEEIASNLVTWKRLIGVIGRAQYAHHAASLRSRS